MRNASRQQRRKDAQHLIDAQKEALVLGGILSGGTAAFQAVSFLSLDDFALERHRVVFKAITDTAPEVDPNLTAVCCRLEEIGKLEAVGGMAGLVEIHSQALPGIALDRFAQKLREKNRDRRAWKLGEKVSVLCEQGFTENSDAVLAITEELGRVAEDTRGEVRGGVQSIRPVREYGVKAIQSVLDGVLYEGTVNVLSGDAGTGKSTLALAIGAAVAAGDSFAGRNTSQRRVLIVDRENSGSITLERLDRLGIRDGNGLTIWGGWCISSGEPPGPEHPDVSTFIRSCNPKPLLVFDSLIAFFNGQSENDSAEMRRYLHGFRRLANAGCSILALHHSGKGEGTKDYRGSSDIKASIDLGLHLSNFGEGRLGRLRVRPWKNRFTVASEIVLSYADGQFMAQEAPRIRTTAERFVEMLKANPGTNGTEFERLAVERDLPRDAARRFLNEGVKANTIRRAKGDHNTRKYTWDGSDEAGL